MRRDEIRRIVKKWILPRMPAWSVNRRGDGIRCRLNREFVASVYFKVISGDSRYVDSPEGHVNNLLDGYDSFHLSLGHDSTFERRASWVVPLGDDGRDVATKMLEYVQKWGFGFHRPFIEMASGFEFLKRIRAGQAPSVGYIDSFHVMENLVWIAARLKRWDEAIELTSQYQNKYQDHKESMIASEIDWTDDDIEKEEHIAWFYRCLQHDRPAIHAWFEKNIAAHEAREKLPPIYDGPDPFVILPPQ